MTTEDPLERHSRRPALQKLTSDLEETRADLMAGFGSRREVLAWMQRLSVRTLGELPDRWWKEMGVQFRGTPASGSERTLLAALLRDDVRERPIDPDDARELRERLFALSIRPAYHRAFRQLRADAGEYLDDDGDESQHYAARQRWVAMRPALDELERYQQKALEELIAGFDDRSAIVDWGNVAELATHGELPREFIARAYREESTASMLLSSDESDQHARELFAAYHLLPRMNAGVRDLAGRTTEQPDAEREDKEASYA